MGLKGTSSSALVLVGFARAGARFCAIALIIGLQLAGDAEAASVFSCSSDGQKCVVKVENGVVGDTVKILDEKAHVVAFGRILRRKGAFAVVNLSQVSKEIRKGYPVIVDVEKRSSNLQWAASFSSQPE